MNIHRNAVGDPQKIAAFLAMTVDEYETYLYHCDLAAQIADEMK